jgi:hypothetical protein
MTERWNELLAELDAIHRRVSVPGVTPAEIEALTARAHDLDWLSRAELTRVGGLVISRTRLPGL